MDAKKRFVRATILLLPAVGLLLAVKNFPTGAPELHTGLAPRYLDFTQTYEPAAPPPPKHHPQQGSAEGADTRKHLQPQNSVASIDGQANQDSPRPELAWARGVIALDARTRAGAGIPQ